MGAPVAARVASVEEVAGETGGGTFGFQPEMVPFSPANRKAAGPEAPPCDTTNPLEPLKTCPEGGAGVWTSSGTFEISPLAVTMYKVDVLDPALETQNGLLPLKETPQGLINSGSVMVASPGTSETRLA